MSPFRRFAVVVLCLSALTFFVDSTSAAAFKHIRPGEEAPSFSLPDTEGSEVSLEAHHGAGPLTIVVFWALWSPNSGPQLADVQRLVDEFGSRGLKALAVNAEGVEAPADLEEQVRALVQKRGLTFPVLVDRKLDQYNAWGVIATPATAFLDRDRRMVHEFSGHPTGAYGDMRARVMEGLGIAAEAAEAERPKHERYHPSDKRVTLNYGLAKTQYERGQFSKALGKLEKVLEDDPKFPDAHALNGALHLALERDGNPEAAQTAREAFRKAAELDGTLPLALAGLAHFALLDGQVAEALALTRDAVEHTEVEDLPELVEEGGAEGEAEPPARDQAPGEAAPEAGGQAEQASGEAEDGGPAARVLARLDRATAAQAAGDAEAAKALLGEVVEGLVALPEGPGAKARKMLERMKKP